MGLLVHFISDAVIYFSGHFMRVLVFSGLHVLTLQLRMLLEWFSKYTTVCSS